MDWLKPLLMILSYFFSPRVRRRVQKERMYKRLKKLEYKYERAMRESDPEKAERLHAKMDEAREQIRYLETKDS